MRLWKPVWRLKYATCEDIAPGCSSRLITGENQLFLKQKPVLLKYSGESLEVLTYIMKCTALTTVVRWLNDLNSSQVHAGLLQAFQLQKHHGHGQFRAMFP